MQRTTLYPFDLSAPGAVDDLLDYHRTTFGCAQMQADEDADDDADDGDADDADQDDDDAEDDDDDKLGPAGVKALQAEKTKRREAQAALREFKALGLTPAQITEAVKKAKDGAKDGEPSADEIRDEARREAKREVARERVGDRIEAKAARTFADPEDAVALILRGSDPDDFLDADGKVDNEAIQEALDELLDKKPHLAAAQGDGKRFKGGGDGGARKDRKPAKATSLEGAIQARFNS